MNYSVYSIRERPSPGLRDTARRAGVMAELASEDEELERYCLGGFGEAQCAHLEEHVLLCETCRARLIETETFIFAVRRAGQQCLGSLKLTSRGAAAVS